jgi:hypothetical protein
MTLAVPFATVRRTRWTLRDLKIAARLRLRRRQRRLARLARHLADHDRRLCDDVGAPVPRETKWLASLLWR